MKQVIVLVLLVLEAWSSWARPSEATGADSSVNIRLLDKDTILQRCPCCSPATFNSPQEMAGSWCRNIDSYENESYPFPRCMHTTVTGIDSDHLRLDSLFFRNGLYVGEGSMNYSKLENGSWLNTDKWFVRNLFFGFSADGQKLFLCGTSTRRDEEPDGVFGVEYARCLYSREDWLQDVVRLRPNKRICQQLPTSTPATA